MISTTIVAFLFWYFSVHRGNPGNGKLLSSIRHCGFIA
jgi:hypothetical protein